MARWYAVQGNMDNDWGYGSYDLEEAKQMLADLCEDYGKIAVIEEGDDPVCVEELTYDDLFDINFVVVDQVKSDQFEDIVSNEDEADAEWDRLTDHDKKERESFYLCKAYTYGRYMVSEIEEIKRYK